MSNNKLVVLMLDGFRWDYVSRDKDNLEGFVKLLANGVQAEYVEPVFPVLSYPNWTTIATGVYPEDHGLIGNYLWDGSKEASQSIFHLCQTETQILPHWWAHTAEPIWTTATKQGRRTFTRFWSRSEVPIDGVVPEEASGYTGAPGAESIQKTLDVGVEKLLQGFDFVMLYGEHTDNVGHAFGPDSDEMRQAIRDVDKIMLEFLNKLEEANLHDVNIVVVSDHGMTYTGEHSGTKYVNLGDYITEDDVVMILDSGTNISIAPVESRKDAVYNKLKTMEGVTVYRREEIPDEFHFKGSRYALDLYLLAKPGYFIRGLDSKEKQVPYREFNDQKLYFAGVHGYTPDMIDQRAIFFATGPAFKKGKVEPPIRMIDIYQVMAHLLKIKPENNHGKWDNVQGMFVIDS